MGVSTVKAVAVNKEVRMCIVCHKPFKYSREQGQSAQFICSRCITLRFIRMFSPPAIFCSIGIVYLYLSGSFTSLNFMWLGVITAIVAFLYGFVMIDMARRRAQEKMKLRSAAN